MILVHQFTSRNSSFFFFRTGVDVNLGTGTARTCIAHFPEVVMLVSVDDVIFREELSPVACSFVIAWDSFARASFEYGNIQIFRIKLQYVYQVFVCPADCFFLEVVAEWPVTQHFEHGVMVCVVTYFFQVIMLSAYTQTLLWIGYASVFGRMVAEDNIFKLVHPCIGKHQGPVILDDHRCWGHNLVSFRLKELDEWVADFICCQHSCLYIM